MRVPIVILALVATPFIADVSAAQGKSLAKGKKDECSKPGFRTGHESIDWILKHFDKSCKPLTTPPPPPPPAPTPPPVQAPPPAPAPDSVPSAPPPQPPGTGTSITGVLFMDYDWGGMPSPDEPRLAGWTVQLIKAGSVVKSATTDATGTYNFLDLAAGSYAVCVTPKAGFVQTWPTSASWNAAACPSGVGSLANVTMYDLNVMFDGVNFGYDVAP
jgi:hypothetical protein